MVTLFFGGWQRCVITAIHLVRAENRVLYDDVHLLNRYRVRVMANNVLRLENLPATDADQLAGNGGLILGRRNETIRP